MDISQPMNAWRTLKTQLIKRAKNFVFGVIGFAFAGVMGLIAAGFMLAAAWIALSDHFGAFTADLSIGGVFLVLSLGIALCARSLMASKGPTKPKSVTMDPRTPGEHTEETLAAATLLTGVGYLLGGELFAKAKRDRG